MSSSIYTRSGDDGSTSLADGTRLRKNAARVEAYGALDEANSFVGAALAYAEDGRLQTALSFLQHRLYNCSSNLALPPGGKWTPPSIAEEDVAFLERAIDRFEEGTGSLTGFVLPGGSKAACFLHLARTACRRAERRVVTLSESEPVDGRVLEFVNRASDLLFAAARYANTWNGSGDILWDKGARPPEI